MKPRHDSIFYRKGVQCKKCGSLERQRIIWETINHKNILNSKTKIIHFAPKTSLALAIKNIAGNGYEAYDFSPKRYQKVNAKKIDLCNDLEKFLPETYDIIIHNHVIEHLPCNYITVLKKLHQLLKPNGIHIFTIPILEGFFDESIDPISEQDRIKRFGQWDHNRVFGSKDLEKTIGSIFHIPAQYDLRQYIGEERLVEINIPKDQWTKYTNNSVFFIDKTQVDNTLIGKRHIFMNGISILISVKEETSKDLDQTLSSILETSIHDPYEIIVLDQTGSDKIKSIVSTYITKTFIRYIKISKSLSPINSFTDKARYSHYISIYNLNDLNKLSKKESYTQVIHTTADKSRSSKTKSSTKTVPKSKVANNDKDKQHPLINAISKNALTSTFCKILQTIPWQVIPDDLPKALQDSEKQVWENASHNQIESNLPLVSVIMPTYNRADIIADSIATVVEQIYPNLELFVCDDASTDNTQDVVKGFKDSRINYLKLEKGGAAATRNAGLRQARGKLIAYLDSDNYWHPAFLAVMVSALMEQPGRSSIYSDFIDLHVDQDGNYKIKSFKRPPFNHESLLQKPFIDLNSFLHTRELYDLFGGFNDQLPRRQDYDLMLKYTWLRDPLHLQNLLTLYHRNDNLNQITQTQKHDNSCICIVNQSLEGYFHAGLSVREKPAAQKVTIISWDLCRNHFSKPFALAEALSIEYDVQLISFRFFEEEIFQPLQGVEPNFETVYLPGGKFPDFFDSMAKALDTIRGDVIYVVKPRLPSLGLALLANFHKKIPIILEINDLETVISSPKAENKHQHINLDQINLKDENLINPYSDLWSQIMDPLAKNLPVLTTHNTGIDAHFGYNCLYMRNIKDEQVYDPGRYERERVRTELGFAKDDRIILFGGMLRKHKGIYELIQLVEKLQDPRYKLLFVGSRPNPDQDELVKKHGDIIKVLPPQDRRSMARINLAADLVILWLNPEVAASHYQMPYKATDALAMQTPIIANDISDLGELGRQGYVRLVPFGDWDNMQKTIKDIFDKPEKTRATTRAGRRLYLRQFSYAAARSNFALAANRALERSFDILPPAEAFTKRFNEFFRHVSGSDKDFGPIPHKQGQQVNTLPGKQSYGEAEEDASVVIIDVQHVESINHVDPEGVAVIMPSINMEKALKTARILVKRAGMKTTVFLVEDTLRQGFIKTLNATAKQMQVRYVVYLAEDAFPGVDWLKIAYEKLEETGKGLLAFNCGKWRGRIAAFGMVRMSWAKKLYEGPVLYPGYQTHKADNELTAIARAMKEFVYEPHSGLFELDRKKIFTDKSNNDRSQFKERFQNGFDNLISTKMIESLAHEYRVPLNGEDGRKIDKSDRNLFPETTDGFEAEFRKIQSWSELESLSVEFDILVIMPFERQDEVVEQTAFMSQRAGIDCMIALTPIKLLEDKKVTLCQILENIRSDFLAFVEGSRHPGLNWLWIAANTVREQSADFLHFNEGVKISNRKCWICRKSWLKSQMRKSTRTEGVKLFDISRFISPLALYADVYHYNPDAVLLKLPPQGNFFQQASEPERRIPIIDHSDVQTSNLNLPMLDKNLRPLGHEKSKRVERVVLSLIADAARALERSPFSVIDKTTLPPSGDKQDYWHPAPYWWPNPNTIDGLPYVNRDGYRVPGTRLYEPESDKYDRSRLQRVFDDSLILSLAWKASGNQKYLSHAKNIFYRFFINPRTKMNPHLKYSQVRMGHHGNMGTKSGIIEMKDLYYYLDVVTVMINERLLSGADVEQFKCWLYDYLLWLLQSEQGREENKTLNNHGTYYDLQVASIAAFLKMDPLVLSILERSLSRMEQHFKPDGSQPHELKRNNSAHYCCFNFQSWINLARLGSYWGVDFWGYVASNGASLKEGARWLMGHIGNSWPYEQIDKFDENRFLPIWFASHPHVEGLPPLPEGIKEAMDVKPVFFPHDGIRPYWNLDLNYSHDSSPQEIFNKNSILLRLPPLVGQKMGEASVKLNSNLTEFSPTFVSKRRITSVKALEYIINAIQKKEPFSFVRMNDGEARIIGAYRDVDIGLVNKMTCHWWKKRLNREDIEIIRNTLLISAASADMLAFYDKNDGKPEKYELCGQLLRKYAILNHNQLFPYMPHYDWQKDNSFVNMFEGLNEVAYVSCYYLDNKLKNKFGFKKVEQISIPGHSKYSHHSDNQNPHWPCVFFETIEKLKRISEGKVFLVGAGVLGKYYCHIIKEHGGIALDLGSVFDFWVKNTKRRSVNIAAKKGTIRLGI